MQIPGIGQRLRRQHSTTGHHKSNWQNTNNNGPVTEKDRGVRKKTVEVNAEQAILRFTRRLTHATGLKPRQYGPTDHNGGKHDRYGDRPYR